ncbi:hypothetical protein [Cynomolgus macaque cytomegalovirus strain Mauritius]|uniref:Uncharacterized protein n=1 Tax=Cynomolgus macaque cytomegalovirus strain Mauritius TaxID=1690255 RepID=A0A0K1H0D3_9BETA|nr:hypothetical protein [Cynomolgus macaque cytomegalovirus strain Mauritius]AXG21914.1 hypothetical protein [synthetic construct]AXG22183.1 hypothetical protein [synthetic construct]
MSSASGTTYSTCAFQSMQAHHKSWESSATRRHASSRIGVCPTSPQETAGSMLTVRTVTRNVSKVVCCRDNCVARLSN